MRCGRQGSARSHSSAEDRTNPNSRLRTRWRAPTCRMVPVRIVTRRPPILSLVRPSPYRMPPNKRLKLAARVDYGMNLSSARRSLSAIRWAAAPPIVAVLHPEFRLRRYDIRASDKPALHTGAWGSNYTVQCGAAAQARFVRQQHTAPFCSRRNARTIPHEGACYFPEPRCRRVVGQSCAGARPECGQHTGRLGGICTWLRLAPCLQRRFRRWPAYGWLFVPIWGRYNAIPPVRRSSPGHLAAPVSGRRDGDGEHHGDRFSPLLPHRAWGPLPRGRARAFGLSDAEGLTRWTPVRKRRYYLLQGLRVHWHPGHR